MLDIAAARERFTDKKISDIGVVSTAQNVADGLTKSMSEGLLRQAMRSGFFHVRTEQCILRS